MARNKSKSIIEKKNLTAELSDFDPQTRSNGRQTVKG